MFFFLVVRRPGLLCGEPKPVSVLVSLRRSRFGFSDAVRCQGFHAPATLSFCIGSSRISLALFRLVIFFPIDNSVLCGAIGTVNKWHAVLFGICHRFNFLSVSQPSRRVFWSHSGVPCFAFTDAFCNELRSCSLPQLLCRSKV